MGQTLTQKIFIFLFYFSCQGLWVGKRYLYVGSVVYKNII